MTPFAAASAQTVWLVCHDGETTELTFWPGPLPDACAIALTPLAGLARAADACMAGPADTVAAASARAVQPTKLLIFTSAPGEHSSSARGPRRASGEPGRGLSRSLSPLARQLPG